MENPDKLIERYLAAFNETDSGRRRELLSALYLSDSSYTDPHADVRGPDGIDEFITQTQERFPGFTFRLGGAIDAHHEQARFQWHAGPTEDPDRYVGFDVIVTEGDRIRSVYGFTDAAPAA
jgi:hypothetical protein